MLCAIFQGNRPMLKPLLFALAFALPAVPAAAQTAPQKMTAADFAKNMQGAVGQEFEGGIKIASITSEANTLVFKVDGPAGWRTDLSPADISSALVGGFCSSAPQFFQTGVTMRIDSVEQGNVLKGPLVSSCPPADAKAN
jgi:hypothetical protein